jgi:phosphonate transport system substrate-binding protein
MIPRGARPHPSGVRYFTLALQAKESIIRVMRPTLGIGRMALAFSLSVVVALAVWSSTRSRLPRDVSALSPETPSAIGSVARARPLRVAMSAAFVSERGVPVYAKIVDYLAAASDVRIELVTGLAYTTINQMLEAGAVDYGFICGYPYILAHDQPAPKVELVAAPVPKDPRYQHRPVYFSDLVVRNDSPFKTLNDLRGRTYVYNEESSNSGYNMPRAYLVELGLTGGFFGKVIRSGSHEASIRMVADGLADASFVDSLVLDYDRAKGFGDAARVRVIHSLGPAATVPFVVSTAATMTAPLKARLLTMHEDPRGRQILDEALLERFSEISDADYDGLRAMKKAAEDARFPEIK